MRILGPWMALAVAALSCQADRVPTAPPSDEIPTSSLTHYTDQIELFVEFPRLVRGRESRFAVHLTRLTGFKAVARGTVAIELSGGGPIERFTVQRPRVPGIFGPVARPSRAGRRRLAISLVAGKKTDRHDLGEVTVYATEAEARRAPTAKKKSATASFLKEQQWRIDFATALVRARNLRRSVMANGRLRARPGGEARIAAPVAGRLLFPRKKRAPRIRLRVREGQVLAFIAPRLSADVDPASLQLAATRARLELRQARRERQRLEGLLAQEAVAGRRVETARHREAAARATLATARRRRAQFYGTQRISARGTTGHLAVRSPISGWIVRADATPGALVKEGQELFHVVDLDRLWLEARIPEADIGRVQGARRAWFRVEGFARRFEVKPPGGRVIGFAGVIDRRTRTAPLYFELANPDHLLQVGMSLRAGIFAGKPQRALAIARTAVVQDAGEDVAYVQVGGESFERRALRLGISDGELREVKAGLRAGERVVTRGAYFVRLAASSSQAPAHGHAH